MPGPLTHSPADIIAKVLIDLSLGLEPPTTPWPVFVSNEPDVPDNCITTYDTLGKSSGRTNYDGEQQEHHGVQVRVRSINHPIGFTKARAIAIALDQSVYDMVVSIGSVSYLVHCVNRQGDIISLGKEVTVSGYKSESPSSRRQIFVINTFVSVREVS
jgi:hypothetical protein